jgi:hypothetical protein
MPPASRASATADYEAGREDPAAAQSPNASISTANNAAKSGAEARPAANSLTPDTSSAADTPPWEAPPWEEPPAASAPPLKLVPPQSPQSNDTTPASPAPPAPQGFGEAPIMSTSGAGGGIVERIKTGLEDRRKPFLAIALEGARKVAVEGEELYVEFAPEAKHLRDNLAKPESIKLLREVCQSVCGREMGVRIAIKDKNESREDDLPAARDGEAEERRRLRELAENHPSVQQVLRAFHAEIVDVRRVDGTSKQ